MSVSQSTRAFKQLMLENQVHQSGDIKQRIEDRYKKPTLEDLFSSTKATEEPDVTYGLIDQALMEIGDDKRLRGVKIRDAFPKLLEQGQAKVGQLIIKMLQHEFAADDSDNHLRNERPGTLLWMAYIDHHLSQILSEEEIGQFAQKSMESNDANVFWKQVEERLEKRADLLSSVKALNRDIYQELVKEKQESLLATAIALQLFVPKLVNYLAKVHPSPAVMPFASQIHRSIQQSSVGALLGASDVKLSNSRRQEGENAVQQLLKEKKQSEVIASIIKQIGQELTLHDATMWLRDEKSGTLMWRAYLRHEFTQVFLEGNEVGKIAFSVLDKELLCFWQAIAKQLATKQSKLCAISELNGLISKEIKAKDRSANPKKIIINAIVLGYFVSEITEHGTKCSSPELLQLAGKILKFVSTNEHPLLDQISTLLISEKQ